MPKGVLGHYYKKNVDFRIFIKLGRVASNLKILYYTAMFPAAPQETVRDSRIEPRTAALNSIVYLAFRLLSHHIPKKLTTSDAVALFQSKDLATNIYDLGAS
jgi:hypothetical protein